MDPVHIFMDPVHGGGPWTRGPCFVLSQLKGCLKIRYLICKTMRKQRNCTESDVDFIVHQFFNLLREKLKQMLTLETICLIT